MPSHDNEEDCSIRHSLLVSLASSESQGDVKKQNQQKGKRREGALKQVIIFLKPKQLMIVKRSRKVKVEEEGEEEKRYREIRRRRK